MPDVTNFPKAGDDKPVSLRSSDYARFDVAYAQALRDKHPAVWSAGGNIKGNAQFAILSRVARQGGKPATRAEEKAVRLREAWAARHYRNHRLAGVVAQVKWLVVGEIGEQKMKALIDAAKETNRGVGQGDAGAARNAAGDPTGSGGHAASHGVLVRAAHVRGVRREDRRDPRTGQTRSLVVVDFIASTEDIDSHDSILVCDWDQDGRLKRYQSNPVLQWMHGRDPSQRPAIGNCENVRVEGKNLPSTAVFDDTTEFDREIAAKYEKGVLRAFSVGFAPGAVEVRVIDGREIVVFSKNELREISAVNVPSNPNALVTGQQRAFENFAREMARAAGGPVDMRAVFERFQARTIDRAAVAFHAYPPVSSGTWDAEAAEKRVRAWATKDGAIDFAKYREAFAWVDPAKADSVGGYKLPHHDVQDGKLVTVRAGVVAAGNAVQGSRGGVKIPDADLPGVKAHLAKHYAQFDMQPPWESGKSAHGHGERPMNVIYEIKETAVRAVDKGMQCDVACPHCEKDFTCGVKVLPMAPEKAAEMEQMRAGLTEKTTALGASEARAAELQAQLGAAQARATELSKEHDALRTLLVNTRVASAEAALTERVGKKVYPTEVRFETDLARGYLADLTPDPENPARTLGEKKWAERLAIIDARPELGIVVPPVSAPAAGSTNVGDTDSQVRGAAEGTAITAGPTRAGDALASLLDSTAAAA